MDVFDIQALPDADWSSASTSTAPQDTNPEQVLSFADHDHGLPDFEEIGMSQSNDRGSKKRKAERASSIDSNEANYPSEEHWRVCTERHKKASNGPEFVDFRSAPPAWSPTSPCWTPHSPSYSPKSPCMASQPCPAYYLSSGSPGLVTIPERVTPHISRSFASSSSGRSISLKAHFEVLKAVQDEAVQRIESAESKLKTSKMKLKVIETKLKDSDVKLKRAELKLKEFQWDLKQVTEKVEKAEASQKKIQKEATIKADKEALELLRKYREDLRPILSSGEDLSYMVSNFEKSDLRNLLSSAQEASNGSDRLVGAIQEFDTELGDMICNIEWELKGNN